MAFVFGGLLLCGVLVAAGLIAYLQKVEYSAALSLDQHDAGIAQAQQWQALTQKGWKLRWPACCLRKKT